MSAPTSPAPSMIIVFAVVSSFQSFSISFLVRWVTVQKRNMIVVALNRALMVLIMRATSDGLLAKCEKRLAVSIKNGAPGGCPISSL